MNIKKYFDFNRINFQSIIFGVRLINDVPKNNFIEYID